MPVFKININIDGWPIQKHGQTLGNKLILEELNLLEQTIREIKDWDINNKKQQGQFLLPERLRNKIQKITKIQS